MKQVTIQGKNITFDPDKHQYFLNDRELHGATRLSRIVAESDWIKWWVGKVCSEQAEIIFNELKASEVDIPEYVRRVKYAHTSSTNTAIDFGNAAHAWCEAFVLWKLGKPRPKRPRDDAVWSAVKPFVDWTKENAPEFLSREEIVYFEDEQIVMKRPVDYCGTLDLRFRLNGKLCIGDFKTGKNVFKSSEAVFQMGLYAIAVEQATGQTVDRLFIFKLPKDDSSKFEVRHFPMTDTLRSASRALNRIKHMKVEVDHWLKNKEI